MPENLKKEWIKLATGKKRLEIANNKFPYLLQLLLKYWKRLEYKFSNIRAKGSYNRKYTGVMERKETYKFESIREKCWIH